MATLELKPCPKCGGKAVISYPNDTSIKVSCEANNCFGFVSVCVNINDASTTDIVRNRWNDFVDNERTRMQTVETHCEDNEQIEEIRKLIDNCDNVPVEVCRFLTCTQCKAERIYNAGYHKQTEAEWIPYSNIVGERQITGWLCGNCKKYSTGRRKYCPECGAKMKGV